MSGEAVELFVTVDQCRRAVVAAMLANIPVALWGESGIGKSTVIRDICEKLGFLFFDFRMSDKEPTDAGGVPVPNMEEKRLEFLTTNLIPWEDVVGENKAALVLDEFDRSPEAMQNMALQLVHDRQVNGKKLGKNVVVILAGNGITDVYTTQLSEAAARRMVHLYVSRKGDAGLRSYETWAESTGINPHHLGFARFCNETWSLGSDTNPMEELGKPCPRTFDMAGRLYDTLKNLEAEKGAEVEDVIMPLMAGCVGKVGAHAYVAWRKMCESAPNPKDVLDDPDGAAIPTEVGVLYALVASLSDCTSDHDTADAVCRFLVRVSSSKQEEIAAMGFRRMISKFPEGATNSSYIKWMKKNKELVQ